MATRRFPWHWQKTHLVTFNPSPAQKALAHNAARIHGEIALAAADEEWERRRWELPPSRAADAARTRAWVLEGGRQKTFVEEWIAEYTETRPQVAPQPQATPLSRPRLPAADEEQFVSLRIYSNSNVKVASSGVSSVSGVPATPNITLPTTTRTLTTSTTSTTSATSAANAASDEEMERSASVDAARNSVGG